MKITALPSSVNAECVRRVDGNLEETVRQRWQVGHDTSPQDVFRYTFVRLMAGTTTATLRADLVQRGFSGKVADAYITLVQSTLFPGRS